MNQDNVADPGSVILAALKVIVSDEMPPGVIGMISHGPRFTSIGVCVLSDPPVVETRTIRWADSRKDPRCQEANDVR